MLQYYPSHTHLKNNYTRIASQHTGITESQLLFCANQAYAPHLNICANQMPAYEKILISEQAKINYHLSGSGIYREEAMARLYGESIERYALLTAPVLFLDQFVYKSYHELAQSEEMIPWEYLKIFTDEEYNEISKFTNIQNISKDEVIGWLKCPSIFEEGKEYYIPAQSLFVGYKPRRDLGEKMFIPGFSKGTAAHVNIVKALNNAIMEAMEADAFMINWYAKTECRQLLIDEPDLLAIVNAMLSKTNYELVLYDYRLQGIPANTFGAALINKKDASPAVIMGCSSSLHPLNAAYRAIVEASTIHYLAYNGPLMSPLDYLSEDENQQFLNLDSNVSYWSKADHIDFKRKAMKERITSQDVLSYSENYDQGSDEKNFRFLLERLRGLIRYGVYLDITPVEVIGKGIKVMRTFFPELVQLSFPGYPYKNHPRILRYGGVNNDLPHPLP